MSGNKRKFTPQEIGTTLFALSQINCDPQLRRGIIEKMIENSPVRRTGRPKKRPGTTVDERRARWVDHHKAEFPEMTDREAVEHAVFMAKVPELFLSNPDTRAWFTDAEIQALERNQLGIEATEIFPSNLDHDDSSEDSWKSILQSISRGRTKIKGQS